MKLLEVEAREVRCTDPFIADERFVSLEEALQGADIVVLGAPHSEYRDLDISPDKTVIDIWNYWPEHNRESSRTAVAMGETHS